MQTRKLMAILLTFSFIAMFIPAVASAGFFDADKKGPRIKRDVDSYEKEGKHYGEDLFDNHIVASSNLDNRTSRYFIEKLIEKDEIDFFGVHSDLKEAFKKGFRQGYQDRTADLVLGPHLQAAAGLIGERTATSFVQIINAFELGWKQTLDAAVDVFITLIAEGSQADREEFVQNFVKIYKAKYIENQAIIKAGYAVPFTSEGGTNLYLDPAKVQTTLDIPSDMAIKTEIYKQTFRAMGDEMGNRFSHNLIPRGELIDWLRRSKTALNLDQSSMDNKTIHSNLMIIKRSFVKVYGMDGDSVFDGIAREAGYEPGSGKK